MATPFVKGGNMLFSQDKTIFVDTARFRSVELQEGEFNDDTCKDPPWQINGYFNAKDIKTLATYQSKERAQIVFNDLCLLMRNGEVADFTFPPDTETT